MKHPTPIKFLTVMASNPAAVKRLVPTAVKIIKIKRGFYRVFESPEEYDNFIRSQEEAR